jgi:hypothetical protein
MNRRFTCLAALSLLGFALACGGGSSSTNPPLVQPQITNFAFLETSVDQSYNLTPMLGKFSVKGSDVQFSTAAAAIDASTGKAVSGAFNSIALSADATKAAFDMYGGTVNAPSNQWDIWVASVSGSNLNLVQITNDADADCCPQFSPDGTKVVFISYRTTEIALVVRNADGTGSEQVLPLPAATYVNGFPTYSPDGSKIAFQAEGFDSNGFASFEGILVINAADGSNPQQLTNVSGVCGSGFCSDSFASYSADGRKIYFTRYGINPEFADIYVVNSDGTGLTMLSDKVGSNFDPLFLRVNGLGDRLLFASNRSNISDPYDSSVELYSMKTDGTSITRLTSNTLFDGFCTMWFGSGTASRGHVQPAALFHAPVVPLQRPDWR